MCISLFREKPECLNDDQVNTLIIVVGQSIGADAERELAEFAAAAHPGYGQPMKTVFGIDGDAALKQRVCGFALDPAILTVYVFRRS